MQNIKDLTLSEIEQQLASFGEKPYKALQVFAWAFDKGVGSFDEMTDISTELRERLKKKFHISRPNIIAKEKSNDGTQKLLLELDDKNRIESVLIPEADRLTLCVSSQAGCPLNCGFCMTGKGGFVRNLKLSEMVDQVFAARSLLPPDKKITNLVLMGMGEPLLNYEEVVKFLNIAVHQKGLGFAPRRVTVSTAGIAPMIERLGMETKVNLAVSLNAVSNDVRDRLMPINKKYPLNVLLKACKEYPAARNRHITFEYILISGINDSMEDAKRLAHLLSGIKCKINLIPFNPFPGSEFDRPPDNDVSMFYKTLMDAGCVAMIRISKGRDISAACGQLKGKLYKAS